MLDCKHKQHKHGRLQKFFQGRQSRHFGCPFQAADYTNANRRSHNALPLLHYKENDPRYCNSPKKALPSQQCFFSHRIKLDASNISSQFPHRMFLFTPWLIAISSRCLAALPATDACVQRSHAASVATLLLRKITRFHDKKTLDTQKNTRLQKQTNTQWKCSENALQCQPYTLCKLIENQTQRKEEIAATVVFVCTGHCNF